MITITETMMNKVMTSLGKNRWDLKVTNEL